MPLPTGDQLARSPASRPVLAAAGAAGGGPMTAETNLAEPKEEQGHKDPQQDLDLLARQVLGIIKHRLSIERERAGLPRGFRR
jgi:hypothetical protein